jgi:SAM-dependent methyltransferase
MRPAFERLGDVHGLHVLDYGCGHGMASVVLARRGAVVTALDLSSGYVAETRRRTEANGAPAGLVQGDGERLPFADKAFDRVWGHAVLHHLDLNNAGREIRRVLKPGGWAVFCEPWGANPVLRIARRWLPYAGKHRTVDEEPLRFQHVRALRRLFSHVEMRGFQLLAMAQRLAPARDNLRRLDWLDAHLLRAMPALEGLCRYVVLTLRP